MLQVIYCLRCDLDHNLYWSASTNQLTNGIQFVYVDMKTMQGIASIYFSMANYSKIFNAAFSNQNSLVHLLVWIPNAKNTVLCLCFHVLFIFKNALSALDSFNSIYLWIRYLFYFPSIIVNVLHIVKIYFSVSRAVGIYMCSFIFLYIFC